MTDFFLFVFFLREKQTAFFWPDILTLQCCVMNIVKFLNHVEIQSFGNKPSSVPNSRFQGHEMPDDTDMSVINTTRNVKYRCEANLFDKTKPIDRCLC